MGFILPGKDIYGRANKLRRRNDDDDPEPAKRPRRAASASVSSRSTTRSPSLSLSLSRSSTPASQASSQSSRSSSSRHHHHHHHHPHGGHQPSPKEKKRWASRAPAPPLRIGGLSRLEALPTELIQHIFFESLNVALAEASLPLSRVLSAQHLRLQYVHAHRDSPQHLTHIFRRRFFTAAFVRDYEAFFRTRLDGAGAHIPPSLCGSPCCAASLDLLRCLLSRRATLDPAEDDVHLKNLQDAIVGRRGRRKRANKDEEREEREEDGGGGGGGVDPDFLLRAMMDEAGVRPNAECLRLAVASCDGSSADLAVCRMLCEKGADAADARVWRSALSLDDDRGRKRVVQILLRHSAPPSDVIGELTSP